MPARVLQRLCALLALLACAVPALAQPATLDADAYVRPDGTLDLSAAPAGALDLSGLDVRMGADGSLHAGGAYIDISTGPSGPPLNSSVLALAVGADGSLYAGGRFTTAGGAPASHVARWDGSAWSPLGSGVQLRSGEFGYVSALVFGADGSLYAGGSFTTAGGAPANSVARWDGNAWSALGSGVNGTVNAMAVGADGSLYAGGVFTTAGGAPASNIARWGGSTWSALGSGVISIGALAVGADGSLYAGGRFVTAGGTPASNIARWDGSAWSALGSGVEGDGVSVGISALAVGADGSLYAGGGFATVSGVPASSVARWDGSTWSALGSGVQLGSGEDAYVIALAVGADGSLYVGGYFTTAGGAPANRIARWDGSAWSPLGSGINPPSSGENTTRVYALAVDANADLAIGGQFLGAGGITSPYLALYDTLPLAVGGAPASGVALSAVVPNPATQRAALVLTLDTPQGVRAVLVDALGREVAVLLDGEAGVETRLDVDTSRLAPGVYVVRVTAGGETLSRRLTVVR